MADPPQQQESHRQNSRPRCGKDPLGRLLPSDFGFGIGDDLIVSVSDSFTDPHPCGVTRDSPRGLLQARRFSISLPLPHPSPPDGLNEEPLSIAPTPPTGRLPKAERVEGAPAVATAPPPLPHREAPPRCLIP